MNLVFFHFVAMEYLETVGTCLNYSWLRLKLICLQRSQCSIIPIDPKSLMELLCDHQLWTIILYQKYSLQFISYHSEHSNMFNVSTTNVFPTSLCVLLPYDLRCLRIDVVESVLSRQHCQHLPKAVRHLVTWWGYVLEYRPNVNFSFTFLGQICCLSRS